MTVSELIQKLSEFPPNAEAHICTNHGGGFSHTTEVDEVYQSTATYGIATDAPTTAITVASMCGL